MTILYKVKGNIYINLTNRCPCNCTFCIRQEGPGVYGSDPLWLEREPSVDEVKAAFLGTDPQSYNEIVFCGYGEPMERAADVALIGKWLKERYPEKTIRLNTNGLGSLICKQQCEHWLKGAVDIVSVSLNAPTKKAYDEITRPKWDNSFEEMIRFAVNCKDYVPQVMFTIVDVLLPEDIDKCRKLADKNGIELRVRKLD
ncbi:MAG: TIGR04100 family radical SAM protein [Ruminococcus sp.]|nr:TIGR04100 family radical SAM protein [Ruminococcus sp.]